MSRWNDPNLPQWVRDRGVTRTTIQQLKRLEAEERNSAWADLPYVSKLDRLLVRPGRAVRQRGRLTGTRKKRALEAKRAREAGES